MVKNSRPKGATNGRKSNRRCFERQPIEGHEAGTNKLGRKFVVKTEPVDSESELGEPRNTVNNPEPSQSEEDINGNSVEMVRGLDTDNLQQEMETKFLMNCKLEPENNDIFMIKKKKPRRMKSRWARGETRKKKKKKIKIELNCSDNPELESNSGIVSGISDLKQLDIHQCESITEKSDAELNLIKGVLQSENLLSQEPSIEPASTEETISLPKTRSMTSALNIIKKNSTETNTPDLNMIVIEELNSEPNTEIQAHFEQDALSSTFSDSDHLGKNFELSSTIEQSSLLSPTVSQPNFTEQDNQNISLVTNKESVQQVPILKLKKKHFSDKNGKEITKYVRKRIIVKKHLNFGPGSKRKKPKLWENPQTDKWVLESKNESAYTPLMSETLDFMAQLADEDKVIIDKLPEYLENEVDESSFSRKEVVEAIGKPDAGNLSVLPKNCCIYLTRLTNEEINKWVPYYSSKENDTDYVKESDSLESHINVYEDERDNLDVRIDEKMEQLEPYTTYPDYSPQFDFICDQDESFYEFYIHSSSDDDRNCDPSYRPNRKKTSKDDLGYRKKKGRKRKNKEKKDSKVEDSSILQALLQLSPGQSNDHANETEKQNETSAELCNSNIKPERQLLPKATEKPKSHWTLTNQGWKNPKQDWKTTKQALKLKNKNRLFNIRSDGLIPIAPKSVTSGSSSSLEKFPGNSPIQNESENSPKEKLHEKNVSILSSLLKSTITSHPNSIINMPKNVSNSYDTITSGGQKKVLKSKQSNELYSRLKFSGNSGINRCIVERKLDFGGPSHEALTTKTSPNNQIPSATAIAEQLSSLNKTVPNMSTASNNVTGPSLTMPSGSQVTRTSPTSPVSVPTKNLSAMVNVDGNILIIPLEALISQQNSVNSLLKGQFLTEPSTTKAIPSPPLNSVNIVKPTQSVTISGGKILPSSINPKSSTISAGVVHAVNNTAGNAQKVSVRMNLPQTVTTNMIRQAANSMNINSPSIITNPRPKSVKPTVLKPSMVTASNPYVKQVTLNSSGPKIISSSAVRAINSINPVLNTPLSNNSQQGSKIQITNVTGAATQLQFNKPRERDAPKYIPIFNNPVPVSQYVMNRTSSNVITPVNSANKTPTTKNNLKTHNASPQGFAIRNVPPNSNRPSTSVLQQILRQGTKNNTTATSRKTISNVISTPRNQPTAISGNSTLSSLLKMKNQNFPNVASRLPVQSHIGLQQRPVAKNFVSVQRQLQPIVKTTETIRQIVPVPLNQTIMPNQTMNSGQYFITTQQIGGQQTFALSNQNVNQIVFKPTSNVQQTSGPVIQQPGVPAPILQQYLLSSNSNTNRPILMQQPVVVQNTPNTRQIAVQNNSPFIAQSFVPQNGQPVPVLLTNSANQPIQIFNPTLQTPAQMPFSMPTTSPTNTSVINQSCPQIKLPIPPITKTATSVRAPNIKYTARNPALRNNIWLSEQSGHYSNQHRKTQHETSVKNNLDETIKKLSMRGTQLIVSSTDNSQRQVIKLPPGLSVHIKQEPK